LNSLNDKVSVVIPVFNSEKFLRESIESILNQTHKNIEIFAIDDGSTDNSLGILEHYSENITIISQQNHGLSTSLNTAIKKITGKWFKWFSPDDVLYPNAIEILLNEAKKLPKNTIAYSNWELIDEENKIVGKFQETDYNDLDGFEFNVRLLDGQQINVNTTLIPSSLFEKGCLLQELKDPVAIDYDFFLRAGILYETRFHLVSEFLVKYRTHPSQLSHKNIANSLSYLSEVRNQILSKIDDSKRQQYTTALEKYNKKKPVSKKTMELGLKLTTNTLPNWITDRLILLYLNKIRRTR